MKFLQQRGVVVVLGVNDLGILGWEEFVEGVFVVGAGFAVDADEESLVTERFDVLHVVRGHILRHLRDPLLTLEEVLQMNRTLQNLVEFFNIRHPLGLGEGEKLRVQGLVRDEHLVGGELVVERERGAVLNAVGNGILVQIALVIFAAEGLEGALAIGGLVHWGAGETDIGGVRQTGHEEVAEIAAGGAVGFVDEDVDIRAGVEVRRHVAELVDHRDDDAPIVVLQ